MEAPVKQVNLDDVWTAHGIPCDGEALELLVRLKRQELILSATSLAKSRCFPVAHTLWQAALPARGPAEAALPLTVEADISLVAGSEHTRGLLTLVSMDRVVVTTDRVVVTLSRGTAESALADANRQPPGAGAQDMNAAGAGKDAAAGAVADQQPSAAASGAPASSGVSAGTGAGIAAGAAGVPGMGGVPRAGEPASTAAMAGNASTQPSAAGAGGAGTGMPVAGTTPFPGAGRGGMGAGGESAAGSAADVADTLARIADIRYWFCVGSEGCVCIENTRGYDEILCTFRPSGCCFALKDESSIGCGCYLASSSDCRDPKSNPEFVATIERCPP